jgi:hypothetical protein
LSAIASGKNLAKRADSPTAVPIKKPNAAKRGGFPGW